VRHRTGAAQTARHAETGWPNHSFGRGGEHFPNVAFCFTWFNEMGMTRWLHRPNQDAFE